MTEIVEAIYQLMGDRTVWAKVKICIFVVYVIKFFVIFLYFIEIELVLFCREELAQVFLSQLIVFHL